MSGANGRDGGAIVVTVAAALLRGGIMMESLDKGNTTSSAAASLSASMSSICNAERIELAPVGLSTVARTRERGVSKR